MKKYKVESDFMYKGLRCVVIMTCMGHRCGYVGISKDNYLYGKCYDEEISLENNNQLMKKLNNRKSIIPEDYFDVHGGITFSNGGLNHEYPVQSDLWWFGFDCTHAWDKCDYEKVKEYNLCEPCEEEYFDKLIQIENRHPRAGIIRTQDYVEQQCKLLADQLLLFEENNFK